MAIAEETLDSGYEQFLINDTILFAVKECLHNRDISVPIKKKILSLLYFVPPEKKSDDSNILGISSDLLNELPEPLTENEKVELESYVEEEIINIYEKLSPLIKQVASSSDEIQNLDGQRFIESLEKNISTQKNEIAKLLVQEEMLADSKSQFTALFKEQADEFEKRLTSLNSNARSLLEEMDNRTIGNRKDALRKVEEALKNKIDKMKLEIEIAKAQLSLRTKN